jgi:GNAT superfamily N-acetyltransferase
LGGAVTFARFIMVQIRAMTPGDLSVAMRLAEQAGWNQTPADWRRFLAMQPDGCFVADVEGAVVGTTVACILGDVAWIAMVLVDEAVRGRGIGTALVRHALDFLDRRGVPSVRLDATALGRPLYERLGFAPQYELARFGGPPQAVDVEATSTIREGRPGDIQEVLEIDRAVTGADRRKFIERLFAERPQSLKIAEERGQISGFSTVRYGRRAVQLGPCIASAAAGAALLADAAASVAGQSVFLDVPIPNLPAVQLAASLGLAVQRNFVRMCRGRTIDDDCARLWASSGPELG